MIAKDLVRLAVLDPSRSWGWNLRYPARHLAGPTPLYAWSLIWLSQDRHPLLRTLLRRFAETGLRRRWLEYEAARDWLPAHDQAELRRLEHMTAHPGA
jgi:hypothetical protein